MTYTTASISSAEPKLVFYPDENPTAAAGMTTGDLPQLLNDTLIGVFAGTVQEGNTEVAVRVSTSNAQRDEVHELTTMPVVSAGGGTVPLDQLGSWSLEPAASGIQRLPGRAGQRGQSLSANRSCCRRG